MWEDPDLGKRLNWLHKYYAIYWCILRWRAPVGAILPMLHVKNAWKRGSCLFGKISMQIAGGWLNRLVSPGGAPSPKTSTTAQRPHTNTNTYILHRNINTNTNTLNFSNAIDKILPRKSYVYIQSNATKNVKSKGLKEAHDCIIGRDLGIFRDLRWAFGNLPWVEETEKVLESGSTGFDGCTSFFFCRAAGVRCCVRGNTNTHTNTKVIEQDCMVSEIFLLQLNFREEMRDVASEMVCWVLCILQNELTDRWT